MNFKEYQDKAHKTAIFPYIGRIKIYPLLGLNGEVGELTEKIKKVHRDKKGIYTEEDLDNIMKELGDILWYLSEVSTSLGISFDAIAELNIKKLKDRQKRGVLKGSGDER